MVVAGRAREELMTKEQGEERYTRCVLVALAIFIFLGYHRYEWWWTGFPPRRLFDLIQILVIPVAVAIGTFSS